MDYLLNFGNTTDYHLPSKVVDLLYFNKPILNFISNSNDSTQAFLKDYDDILNLNLTDIGQEEINQFIQFVNKERQARIAEPALIENYTSERLGKMYLDLMEGS